VVEHLHAWKRIALVTDISRCRAEQPAADTNGHIRSDTPDVSRHGLGTADAQICRRNGASDDRAYTRVTPQKGGVNASSPLEGLLNYLQEGTRAYRRYAWNLRIYGPGGSPIRSPSSCVGFASRALTISFARSRG